MAHQRTPSVPGRGPKHSGKRRIDEGVASEGEFLYVVGGK